LNPSYRPLADLPLHEKSAAMRDPDLRRRLLSEQPESPNPFYTYQVSQTKNLFVLGDPPNYTPRPEENLSVRAAAAGLDPRELIYDELLKNYGHAILYSPRGNMDDGRPESASLLAGQPGTVIGLGDGGAHYGMVCDAGWPTYVLTRCARDAPEDRKLSWATAIKLLSHDPAVTAGLPGRGLLRCGYKADVNILDPEQLHVNAPRVVRNLPGRGRRLVQDADGYVTTIVSGQITYRDGKPTGQLPGRLVRGQC
jgi:N-acyl-D-amino-acid deacylase